MGDIIFQLPKVILNLHTHGRGMRQRCKTTVRQVFTEAKDGLIDILGFMPNTDPAIITINVLAAYLKLIQHAKKVLDFVHNQYIWFGATDNNLDECDKALRNDFVIGLKIYPLAPTGKSVTTGTIGVMHDETILRVMKLARKFDRAVAVHCDDPIVIGQEGNTIRAEAEYIKKILRLAKEVPGVKIMICHVSNRNSAELILQAQREKMQIAMELCPHYLWFDGEGTNWNSNLEPVFYHCFNNLRSPEHRKFLVSLLSVDNPLIIIGSDHAPHTREEKMKQGLGGLPTLLEMVPVIVTLALKEGISEKRVAELLSFNASRFFGIEVPRKLVEYVWEERLDDLIYNEGRVVNPWNGSRLYFSKEK